MVTTENYYDTLSIINYIHIRYFFTFIIGVPADKKENAVAMMQKMTLEVSRAGEFVNMKTTTPSGSREVKIKPGEESEYTTTTGLKMRVCMHIMACKRHFKRISSKFIAKGSDDCMS